MQIQQVETAAIEWIFFKKKIYILHTFVLKKIKSTIHIPPPRGRETERQTDKCITLINAKR